MSPLSVPESIRRAALGRVCPLLDESGCSRLSPPSLGRVGLLLGELASLGRDGLLSSESASLPHESGETNCSRASRPLSDERNCSRTNPPLCPMLVPLTGRVGHGPSCAAPITFCGLIGSLVDWSFAFIGGDFPVSLILISDMEGD